MRAEMMTEIVWQVDEEVNWLRQDWWGWRNESMTKLWQTVFTQYRNVTDGRTDRRTDLLYQYRASDRVCWRAIKREETCTDTGIVRAGLSLLLPVLRGCQKLASNYTPVVVDTFSRHIYLLFHLLPDAYLSSPESVLLCHPMLVCRQFLADR